MSDTSSFSSRIVLIAKGLLFWVSYKLIQFIARVVALSVVTSDLRGEVPAEELTQNVESVMSRFSPEIGIVVAALFLAIVSLIYLFRNTHLVREVKLSRVPAFVTTSFLVAGLLSAVALTILLSSIPFPQDFAEGYQKAVSSSNVYSPAAIFLTIFLAPFCEEILYRGLLHRTFRSALPRAAAMILSSAIFAIDHGHVLQMIYAFLFGLLLSYLYDKTNSLLPPILFHIGFNAASYLVLLIPAETPMIFRMLILLVSFLLAVFLIILLCYSVSFWTLHLPKEKLSFEEPKSKKEKKADAAPSLKKEEPKEEETSYTVIELPPPKNYPPVTETSSVSETSPVSETQPENESPSEIPPEIEPVREVESVPET
ncbi:MAG: CPBP family intramembrane metalloprotease [Clostridia bacterium]|nr:CPBP family intramembrane metalloprotease [Clostridia bacterium]